MAKITEPLIVSVVAGNGYTHATTQRTKIDFPSVIGVSQTAFNDIDLTGNVGSRSLILDGVAYHWGYDVYRNSRLRSQTMGSEKLGADTYIKLILAALYELFGAESITLDILVTTTPVYNYQKDREPIRDSIAGVYQLSDGRTTFVYNIPRPAVKVLPEGLPTVYNQIYSNNLTVQRGCDALLHDAVGVVNIGTYTTDLIKVERQQPVLAQCRSIDYGMARVWDELQRFAKTEYNRSLSYQEADDACKLGYFKTGNQKINVLQRVESITSQIADMIQQEISIAWDGGKSVEHIIAAGGGAPQIPQLWKRYEDNHVWLCDDIATCAATETDGAYKFARIKAMNHAT